MNIKQSKWVRKNLTDNMQHQLNKFELLLFSTCKTYSHAPLNDGAEKCVHWEAVWPVCGH